LFPPEGRQFFEGLNDEIKKAQGFFLRQEIDAKKKFEELTHHVTLLGQMEDPVLKQREFKRLRAAFLEFYRQLNLLKNFCLLNYAAIGKIIKKFDKNALTAIKKNYLAELDKDNLFNTGFCFLLFFFFFLPWSHFSRCG